MSQTPELPEAGGLNLQRALNDLPTYEPDAATWSRIETQLAADAALTRGVAALPEHEPDELLRDTIAARLDEKAPAADLPSIPVASAVVRPLWPARTLRRMVAVAARVLILLGVWWQQRPTTAPGAASGLRETMAFSEEMIATPLPSAVPVSEDPLEQEDQAFIDAHCSSLPTVCQSGEFKSLRTQLTELEAEEEQLRQDACRFGESPELLR